MTPRPLAATLSAAVKDQILDAIMTTVTHIHDATDIMAFCKVLFGEAETERANEVSSQRGACLSLGISLFT